LHKKAFFTLIVLASLLLLIAFNPYVAHVKAQGTATVDMLTSLGGSTTPTGTTTYPDGTVVTLTATEGSGFVFQYWTIVTSTETILSADNPYDLTVSDSTTYGIQATFLPINVAEPPLPYYNGTSGQAVVVLLAAIGGTTSPAAGTYAFTNAKAFSITATPASGWTFDHWLIGGYPLSHGAYSFTAMPTDNPYNVNHGYGYTYSYQPVFSPTTVPEISAVILPAILAIIFIVGELTTYTFRKRK
jgi:hypothetical protein